MSMTRLHGFLLAALLISAGSMPATAGSLLQTSSTVNALHGSGLLAIITVPEPGAWVLMGTALLVVFGLSRRKVQKIAQLSSQREIGPGRDVK